MNHDIDIKNIRINCFRQSKVAGEFMLQLRVPGSLIEAKYLQIVQDIAQNGEGNIPIWDASNIKYPMV